MVSVQSCVDFLIVLFMDCVLSWSLAPKLQEDEIGTLTSISYCSSGLLTDIPLTGAARVNPGHGTKIARGLVRYRG